jgi:transcriptional regulator with XRE-family HTH domain
MGVRKVLSAKRLEAGLTLAMAASQLSVSKSRLSQLEHGSGSPSLGLALRIAELYRSDVKELFGWAETDESKGDAL